MSRHHIIISGTGRAGTTFLVQLLTQLGLDTGISDSTKVDSVSNAGLEWNILDETAPYIVKSPHLSNRLSAAIVHGDLTIDHAIVPMRDLYEAAESRRFVEAHPRRDELGDIAPGGMWGTADAEDQEAFLAKQTHALMHALAVHEIPVTLLDFPRLARDTAYLSEKLAPIFPDAVATDHFTAAFAAVARPDLIHHFDRDDDDHKDRIRHLSTTQDKRTRTASKGLRDLLARNIQLNRERARAVQRAEKAEERARIAEAALAAQSGGIDATATSVDRTSEDMDGGME